jgi:hypothetical protein
MGMPYQTFVVLFVVSIAAGTLAQAAHRRTADSLEARALHTISGFPILLDALAVFGILAGVSVTILGFMNLHWLTALGIIAATFFLTGLIGTVIVYLLFERDQVSRILVLMYLSYAAQIVIACYLWAERYLI